MLGTITSQNPTDYAKMYRALGTMLSGKPHGYRQDDYGNSSLALANKPLALALHNRPKRVFQCSGCTRLHHRTLSQAHLCTCLSLCKPSSIRKSAMLA